jgi:hypothetical protein
MVENGKNSVLEFESGIVSARKHGNLGNSKVLSNLKRE